MLQLLLLYLFPAPTTSIINLRQFDNKTYSYKVPYFGYQDSNASLDPVVLVPGIFGSQLDAWYNKTVAPHYICSKDSGGFTTIWLCFQCMVPKVTAFATYIAQFLLQVWYYLYRCTRNTTISTSTSNFGSSGRVDGPLLETHSLLTCHQPYR